MNFSRPVDMSTGRLKLFFNSRFPREDGRDSLRREFGLAVVGVQAILPLFHICQLGVAEAENPWVVQQNAGQTLKPG